MLLLLLLLLLLLSLSSSLSSSSLLRVGMCIYTVVICIGCPLQMKYRTHFIGHGRR